jgi:hypothetical protein
VVLVWIFAGMLVFFAPMASVVGLAFGAYRLSRRGAPRLAAWGAYGLTALVAFVTLGGYVAALIAASRPVQGDTDDASQKARRLAEGISAVMNCGALALLIAIGGAAWLGFWAWRMRSPKGH